MIHNLQFAAQRFPESLSIGPHGRPPYLVARNVAPRQVVRREDFVLMPQNLWAWNGATSGMWEWWWRERLRLASEISIARSLGVLRICGDIPCREKGLGDPLPNVLDGDFEGALQQSVAVPYLADAFVCYGSGISYKNTARLLEAYRLYRTLGGRRPIHLFISPPRQVAIRSLEMSPGCTPHVGQWSRAEVLSGLHSSFAVIFPSMVEASPIAVLESIATGCRLILSDLPSHRSVTRNTVPDECYFPPNSADELANAMLRSESLPAVLSHFQATPSARATAREQWARAVCEQLALVL